MNQITIDKRAFRKMVNDCRGKELLNVLLEQELSLILHPQDALISWQRNVAFEVVEWRLKQSDNEDQKIGTRISNLRQRIKQAIKKQTILHLTPEENAATIKAANQKIRAKQIEEHAFHQGYDLATRQAASKLEYEAKERKKKRTLKREAKRVASLNVVPA